MEARQNGEKMNTSSSDLVDDNIELIDISAEDDGFLISSPLFDSLEDLLLAGLGLITTKKAAWQSSSRLKSSCLSSPKFSSSVSMTPKKASSISGASVRASNPRVSSSLFSKNTESKKGKLHVSHSTSKILRYSEKSKGLGNTNLSTRSFSALDHSSCTSPARFSNHSSSVSLSSSLSINQKSKVSTTKLSRTSQRNDAKVAPDLESNPDSNLSHSPGSREMKSPIEFSSHALARFHRAGSESLETVKASGLRMPSPKIGYFDEIALNVTTTLKLECRAHLLVQQGRIKEKQLKRFYQKLRKQSSILWALNCQAFSLGHTASYKKPKNPCSKRSRTFASSKTAPKFPTKHVTDKEICSKFRKTSAGKCHTHKIGQNCRLEKERHTMGLFKNEKCKESKGSNYDTCVHLKGSNSIKNVTEDGSRIGDLSIYLKPLI
ncbi:Uncharacterized protein Adt_11412 [Abeliophyllum distichum]|uniref:Uncharacterized protein n=1 Tax=Abeliophyllum distichum TaxID=126358 RepID=A0ABD1UNR5_9LAMI